MNKAKTILITGGTGLTGRRLTTLALERGYQVIILTQRKVLPASKNPALRYAYWNVKNKMIDDQAILDADIIIHLAGAGVAEKRWTNSYKQEIADSRIQGGALLSNALQRLPHHVSVFLSASAIGWYGPDKMENHLFSEAALPHSDFLGQTCKLWEQSVEKISSLNVRLCILRTGIVLTTEGGALKEFLRPIKMGVVPVLGNGQQIISWIHINDLCEMYFFLINHQNCAGIYNAVASNPTSNKKFIQTLAKHVDFFLKFPIRIPAWALRIIMGESSIEVLKSTSVSNQKIKACGFTFSYEHLNEAFKDLVGK